MGNDHVDVTEAAVICGQVSEHTHRALAGLAESVTDFEGGFAVRTDSLPLVWTLNQVRIVGSATAAAVLVLADQFQADLGFRHVVVEGDLGATLVGPLGAEGWWSEREVVMAMARPVDRGIDTSGVVELSEPSMLALMRAWLLEEREGITEAGLDQVSEYNRLEGALFNETRLGVVEDDEPLAVTKLRSSDGIAWIEDVYTTPSARGRGLARALIAEAVTRAWRARPRFAFIVADDDDWPKNFYARAGFVPVSHNYTFHRNTG
jgi:GNAT superfamily N-acetyltransferase/predicted regulator of Ras-like GTPase activity (Roadblock/LC7/MglB family)